MFGLTSFPDAVVRGFVLSVAGVLWVVILVRLVGLRAFSKMTAFDFVITLATGSLLATAAAATSWNAYLQAIVAIGAIMAVKVGAALLRRESRQARNAIENGPLLLMRDGAFIDAALAESRVSRSDVVAKLRAANVLDPTEIRAVVLETTGDISVLHGDALNAMLLDGVR
ncbi:DUF421 domain-containing protein [Sphingomonas koreensis]|nr:DUF421 domain-containing protein [Sphingomonas koreensis]